MHPHRRGKDRQGTLSIFFFSRGRDSRPRGSTDGVVRACAGKQARRSSAWDLAVTTCNAMRCNHIVGQAGVHTT